MLSFISSADLAIYVLKCSHSFTTCKENSLDRLEAHSLSSLHCASEDGNGNGVH